MDLHFASLLKYIQEEYFFRGMYFEYIKSDLPPVVHIRKWDRRNFHYDNCFVAMLTLFAVQTSEGWVA